MVSSNNALSVFNYQGANITFDRGDAVMVNATEMAKPFGKSASHWLRNQQVQEFMSELSKLRICNLDDLVQVKHGGIDNGTWMHEDVALEFARWLSPHFAIWCNDRIKELLTQGVATISDDDEVIARAMGVLQRRLEDKTKKLEQAEARIAADRPKVVFADAIFGSQTSCLVGELAKVLRQNGVEMGERRLFAWMREHGYLGKRGERYNIPNQQYLEQGLFELKKGVRTGSNGVLHTTTTTKVTLKGQQYFIAKLSPMILTA